MAYFPRRSCADRDRFRPALEGLEERALLSAGAVTARLSGGVLTVVGSRAPDRIALTLQGQGETAALTLNDGRVAIDVAGVRNSAVPATDVARFRIDGGNGSDTLVVAAAVTASGVLSGGPGNDSIVGGGGNVSLFGGPGNDRLRGGRANNSFFAAPGQDTLHAGSGPNLFLLPRDESARLVGARRGRDAFISFQGSADADWTSREIVQVEAGLARLLNRTNNTRLLKRADGRPMTFVRAALAEGDSRRAPDTLADNADAGQALTFYNVTFTSRQVAATVVHEIGHNFDAPATNRSFVARFRAAGGWTERNPHAPQQFVASGDSDERWWYRRGSLFVSEYANSSPYEDFAETFAVAVGVQRSDRPAPADKLAVIDDWLNNWTSAPHA